MASILNPSGRVEDVEIEADVIVTSVIVGFCLTRVLQAEPFSVDIEPRETRPTNEQGKFDEDRLKTQTAVAYLKRVLSGLDGIDSLRAGVSASHGGYGDSALITGRASGAHLTERHRDMQSPRAIDMRRWERGTSSEFGEEIDPDYKRGAEQYHGRGAYTGMIDDPIGDHTMIQPTLRRVLSSDALRYTPDRSQIWGLIGMGNRPGKPVDPTNTNLDNDPTIGMGPMTENSGIVQYIHGMSWAMREAVRWGPWCNAYEMAVGPHTKKLASCFPCTTYMYAAGFPPSSCHFGKGESWGILPDGTQAYNHAFSAEMEGNLERAIARSINIRWHTQIYHYLREGSKRLRARAVRDSHQAALARLISKLDTIKPEDVVFGGNFFLDALTYHKGECDRVLSVMPA